MRYIPVERLSEGMVLGQPFYGKKFEILLAPGMTLNTLHIKRINEMGYAGVYVIDDLTQDVVMKDIIPADVRVNTIRANLEFVLQAEKVAESPAARRSKSAHKVTKLQQQKIITPIIDSLIANDRRVIDVVDLKPYDYYNYYHAANVVVISLLVGVVMGISGNQLFDLGMAALLHDIGSCFVPKYILEKPDKLTPEEYDIVKSHCDRGFEYLRENYDVTIETCLGALHHHEHYDGSGYPNGLKKDKISILGRIINAVDVYDALISRRPFRDAMFPYEALEIMHKRAGKAFDPNVIKVLDQVICPYPAGVFVELDTGVQCLVVENYPAAPKQPRLRLVNNASATPLYIDLHQDANYRSNSITKIIK